MSTECKKKSTIAWSNIGCVARRACFRAASPTIPNTRVVPRTHVVSRSCFAQDIGSYKAYAVCTCNLTLTSRIYRNGDPPSVRIVRMHVWRRQLLSLPPEQKPCLVTATLVIESLLCDLLLQHSYQLNL